LQSGFAPILKTTNRKPKLKKQVWYSFCCIPQRNYKDFFRRDFSEIDQIKAMQSKIIINREGDGFRQENKAILPFRFLPQLL